MGYARGWMVDCCIMCDPAPPLPSPFISIIRFCITGQFIWAVDIVSLLLQQDVLLVVMLLLLLCCCLLPPSGSDGWLIVMCVDTTTFP